MTGGKAAGYVLTTMREDVVGSERVGGGCRVSR